MLIIGIDPGISGSLCFFNDGKIIDLVEMPSMAEILAHKVPHLIILINLAL